MAENDIMKQHISITERGLWNKVVADFALHLGSGGTQNHALGNGTTPGFAMNDFSNALKTKLDGIEVQANKYIHPSTHPASMITGLHDIAITGNYNSLINKPTSMPANGGNSDTVNGNKITVGSSATANAGLWFDTVNQILKAYYSGSWYSTRAVYQ